MIDLYKETMQTIRHYGALRFVLLPVYLTATAVLFGQLYNPSTTVPRSLLIEAGIGLALLFSFFEWAITSNLKSLWDAAKNMATTINSAAAKEIWKHRTKWWLRVQT